MQKRALIRLLAGSAALVLMISVCCVTVCGYEPDTAENTYTNGTVTKDEENSPVEPTPDPTEEPVQTPTPTEKPAPSSSESSASSESSTSSESSSSSKPVDSSGGNTC